MCFAQKELAITVCQDGFKFIVVFDIEFRKFCSLKGRGRTVASFFLCRVISCPTNMSRHLRPRHTMRQIAATRRRDRLLQQIASFDM